MKFKVNATVRKIKCDKNSSITHLVIDPAYNGYTVHSLESLKPLADRKLLYVDLPGYAYDVLVEIYWSSKLGVWVARTNADSVLFNNLDQLPIYASSTGSYYEVCPR